MSEQTNAVGSSSMTTSTTPQTTQVGQKTVEISIPEGEAKFHVDGSPLAKDLLYNKLSWQDPDAKFSDSYKNGSWDGYHRLYDRFDNTAPIGLLDRAVRVLEDAGYTVETDHEYPLIPPIETEWQFDHQLRDYQVNCINDTLESRGGIISLPTGAGKTVIALNLIHNISAQSIVFVHTKQLLYQWRDRIKEILGVEPGIIGDNEWSEGPITVATMQTLNSKGTDKLDQNYGVGIFDECHRTAAAQTMQEVGLNITPMWRIGLSATPWRSTPDEEMEIEAVTGGVAAEITATRLVKDGFLAEPQFEFLTPEDARTPNPHNGYHKVIRRCIVRNPGRNQAIANKAAELAGDGEKVLITVDQIAHGQLLEYALSREMDQETFKDDLIDPDDIDSGELLDLLTAIEDLNQVDADVTASFLDGSATKTQRETALSAFESGEIDILITTLLKEGTDIPKISAIVHAEGKKSKIQRIQRAGRALRPENGSTATIVDVADDGKYLGDHFEHRVQNLKEYYGDYAPDYDL